MYKPLIVVFLIVSVSLTNACSSNADDANSKIETGLIKKSSDFSYDQTVTNLEAALAARNITLMSKVDHAANAAMVDKALRPTTLLIFGNPAIGAELMKLNQSFGLDLPMKALVYEDDEGNVWVQYNDMAFLAGRHDIPSDNEVISRVSDALDAITTDATLARE
ncbi:MAG: hypothetical protein DHS20C05_23900 [Hyphococcus sp.]|nr:MAG: hypothetical protein DHS20C05_23900 [Marinicaulis sp.]